MQDLTQPTKPDVLSNNPFRDDVYSPHSPIPGTPQIHQEEMNQCLAAIEKMVSMVRTSDHQAHGEMISISSPLAGYGKTHLINRISKSMPKSVCVIDLSFGPQFSWGDLLGSTLQKLDSSNSSTDLNISRLDEVAAFFLSTLIRTAMSQGVLEEKDCPVSKLALKSDYAALFSEGGRSKFLGWMKKKSPTLRTSVNLFNSKFGKFSKDDTSFWFEYFLNHCRNTGINSMDRTLETESRDRFLQLLRISSICHPLLVVADHLDCCHGSPKAGMDIATALTSILEHVSNCVLVISFNQDLWESVFRDKLPSALLDRLNGENLELAPVGIDEAKELLINRLCSSGVNYEQAHHFANAVTEDCAWADEEGLFPRRIIREAREIWRTRSHEFIQPGDHDNTPSEKPESGFESTQYGDPNLDFYPDSNVAPPMPYSEPKSTPDPLPNPFEGHSMYYSDRPIPMDSVPETGGIRSFSDFYKENTPPIIPQNPQPGNLQAGRMDAEPLPLDGYPQTHPASQHKDEPSVHPPAGASPLNVVNGKTNGHAVEGHAQKSIDIINRPSTPGPIEAYFGKLEKHYGKKSEGLTLDFPTLEGFIKTVGMKHSPLTQNELNIAGGQSACLRWVLPNYTVWIGFEPSRNIYFYSNVLQKVLSDPSGNPGKIVCFSHASSPFNRDLLTTNGFTEDILRRYFDCIQLSNPELVLIYSAAQLLKETIEKGHEAEGLKFVIKKLNPLWQRLCQPVGDSIK